MKYSTIRRIEGLESRLAGVEQRLPAPPPFGGFTWAGRTPGSGGSSESDVYVRMGPALDPADTAMVGDPTPQSASARTRCGQRHPESRWMCTRPPGHRGQHVSGLPGRQLDAVWPNGADVAQVGDPDPTTVDGQRDCPAVHTQWACTRDTGHRGQHVAGDNRIVVATWPADLDREQPIAEWDTPPPVPGPPRVGDRDVATEQFGNEIGQGVEAAAVDGTAATLRAHARLLADGVKCLCGWGSRPPHRTLTEHARHVAEQLAAVGALRAVPVAPGTSSGGGEGVDGELTPEAGAPTPDDPMPTPPPDPPVIQIPPEPAVESVVLDDDLVAWQRDGSAGWVGAGVDAGSTGWARLVVDHGPLRLIHVGGDR